MYCVVSRCTWQSGSFGRPWLKRFARGLPELCLQCGSVKGSQECLCNSLCIWIWELSDIMNIINCSFCFRIRLEKKVGCLELCLMDCSMIIKSYQTTRISREQCLLHRWQVLHVSCFAPFVSKTFSNRVVADGYWLEAALSACPTYFISIL